MSDELLNPALKLARAQAAEAERLANLVRAYKMVFGDDPSKRTVDQELVMEDLERTAFFRYSTAKANAAGIVDPHQTSINEGKRMLLLYILANVNHVAKPEQQPQQK